jgi:hypothetical protein
MTPEEALEYGIIDKVITQRPSADEKQESKPADTAENAQEENQPENNGDPENGGN